MKAGRQENSYTVPRNIGLKFQVHKYQTESRVNSSILHYKFEMKHAYMLLY